MKNISCTKNNLTRQKLANPFPKETLHERLVNEKTIDLTDNHTFKDLGKGYCRIIPKDKTKLVN